MKIETLASFDAALDAHMSSLFGRDNAWRGTCHRAAKVAAAALRAIYPGEDVQAIRVELLAYMEHGTRFAHIGWRGDERAIQGQYPMHWAVRIGDDLYDPCFWQLHALSTPLRLPSTPFFFAEGWFEFARSGRGTDAAGVTWVVDGGAPALNIGYLVCDEALPDDVVSSLMTDDQARLHAKLVRAAYALKAAV
ncbi:hypothetical protein ACWV27_25570 (plasmid) [Massilia varians]|jgi:hypothetical protein